MNKDKLVNVLGVLVFVALVWMTLVMLQNAQAEFMPMAFQCADCENKAKTENSISDDYDELYLEEGQIITAVYVKAGQGCFVPDGSCYNVVGGGVGFNYVQIERIGSGPECQGISHLEVCFSSPYPTDTPEPTFTFTPTPEDPTSTPTDTPTPDPSITSSPTDIEVTETPTPTWTPHPPRTPNGNGRG